MRKYIKHALLLSFLFLFTFCSVCTTYAATDGQTIFVRFITSWNNEKAIGGMFKITNNNDFKLTDTMQSANYMELSDKKNAGFDSVAVWDVWYSEGATSLSSFPDIVVNQSDEFIGWMDIDGNFVTENDIPRNGNVYTAVYKIAYNTDPNMTTDTKKTVPKTVASVNFVIDGKKGSFDNLNDMNTPSINTCVLSEDNQNLTVYYNSTGKLENLPDIHSVDKYEFKHWIDTNGNVIDTNTKLTDNAVYKAVFEKNNNSSSSDSKNNNHKTDSSSDSHSSSDNHKGSSNHKTDDNSNTIKKDSDTGDKPNNSTNKENHDIVNEKTNQDSIDKIETSPNKQASESSWNGIYTKTDGTTGNYKAAENTGWLTKAEDIKSDDGTQLYYDSDGNVVSYPTGHSKTNDPYRYLLHVTNEKGETNDFGCTDNQTLSEVTKFMGYEISSYTLKQAEIKEHEIDGETTLASIVNMLENGDICIIGYKKDHTQIGCAVIRQTVSNYEFKVSLQKKSNVKLRTFQEVDLDIQNQLQELAGEVETIDGGGITYIQQESITEDTQVEQDINEQMSVNSIGLPIYFGFFIVAMGMIFGYFIHVKNHRKKR